MKWKIRKELNGTTVSEIKIHHGISSWLDTTKKKSVDVKTQENQLSTMKHGEK